MADVRTFEAQVKVPNGGTTMIVKTRVMAEDQFRAKLLLEQQYGRGSLVGMPREVK